MTDRSELEQYTLYPTSRAAWGLLPFVMFRKEFWRELKQGFSNWQIDHNWLYDLIFSIVFGVIMFLAVWYAR